MLIVVWLPLIADVVWDSSSTQHGSLGFGVGWIIIFTIPITVLCLSLLLSVVLFRLVKRARSKPNDEHRT